VQDDHHNEQVIDEPKIFDKSISHEKEDLKRDEQIKKHQKLYESNRVKSKNEQQNSLHSTEEMQWLTLEIFSKSAEKENAQQRAIKQAVKHSWNGYRDYAWGEDHLKPITKSSDNWFGVGLTILDSLDTLIIMGLEKEYQDGLEWVKGSLSFDNYKDVNCFEMTIRALAGLLSAYHFTSEPTLLVKASDVGERLIHCFDTPTNLVPFSDVNLKSKNPKTPTWAPESSLSEVTTVQVEFRDLAALTGVEKYEVRSNVS
jgi:mannosyl-oligosaccharide alpha-1,2-mannosidase